MADKKISQLERLPKIDGTELIAVAKDGENYSITPEQITESVEDAVQESLDKKADKATVSGIEEKIPTQASKSNQLADRDFVNSSIATSTAEFKGTFSSLSELQKVSADDNDYGIVVTQDVDGNTVYNRYKWTPEGWKFEFSLNNSSFTSDQWKAIMSGITEDLVRRISEMPNASDLLTKVQAAKDYATKNELDVVETLAESVNTGLGDAIERLDEDEEKIDSLESSLAEKANISDLSNVIAEEIVDGTNFEDYDKVTREQLKKDLFIDMWIQKGTYGNVHWSNYDESHGDTPFYLNELWLTYEEALDIYSVPKITIYNTLDQHIVNSSLISSNANKKTIFPIVGGIQSYIESAFPLYMGNKIKSIVILDYYNADKSVDEINNNVSLFTHIFSNTNSLKGTKNLEKIITGLTLPKENEHFPSSGYYWDVLKFALFNNLNGNFTKLRNNNVFQIDCLKFMIEHANPTTTINIQVSSAVYNKLLGIGVYSDGNGTQEEWTQLFQDATDKQISFITA